MKRLQLYRLLITAAALCQSLLAQAPAGVVLKIGTIASRTAAPTARHASSNAAR